MTQTYYAVLTEVGEAKLANATALGTPLQLTRMAVGDGGGSVPVPNRSAKNLVGERYRANLNTLQKDPLNGSQVIAELVLPETVGGWWIREIGLFDAAGDLIAYSNAPETYKPQMAEGSARTQVVRMVLLVSSVAAVELKVDPSVVLATREFVTTTVAAELAKLDAKQSVRYATTGNVVLSGLAVQANGDWPSALSAGDRILVKNQNSAKDNGLWAASSGAWTRTADADIDAKVTPALTVSVESGTTLADTVWQLVTDAPIVVGTTALAFQDITNGLARLASPAFTGNPTAPTPAQFDNDTSLATTAFVQRAMGNFSGQTSYSASTQLTAADAGKLILISAASTTPTLTLPDAASVPVGTAFWFCGNAQNFPPIIAAKGTDSLVRPDSSVGSIQMSAHGTLLVRKAASGAWFISDGTDAFRYMHSLFGASLGASGYRRTPSGDIEQWGLVVAAPSGSNTVITLPTAYTVGVHNIGVTFANFTNDEAVGSAPVMQARASGLGTITVRNLHTGPVSFFWTTKGK